MDRSEFEKLPRHARAALAAAALAGSAKDEDARTLIAYWRSCLIAADRAAEQVLQLARARGLD